jgi:hypothetical protein
LHAGVQNGTTTGQTRWKLPIRAFIQDVYQGCFKNQLDHNMNLLQPTKLIDFCWTDASLPNQTAP